jgi:hypothetical protein
MKARRMARDMTPTLLKMLRLRENNQHKIRRSNKRDPLKT